MRSWRLVMGALLLVGVGACAPSTYQYREASYSGPIQPGMALQRLQLDPALEERILALDPEHITERDVRELLSQGPTPRIINVHGGIPLVYLAMESFGEFLIGMGYPEGKIRSPRDGTYSYSPYKNSAEMAGIVAWYYEREGMRVNLIGHSHGGIQVVKVLHELAGTFSDRVAVWNPLTEEQEERDTIIDPLTGAERPVVGLQAGYATAVGAGGWARFLPNAWVTLGKLRTIPDTVEEFTGFFLGLDLIGGDFMGLATSLNTYEPNGTAKVRNVELPAGYHHVTLPATAHLAQNQAIRDWINAYVPGPGSAPEPTVEFDAPSTNILWAADVWYSLKKQWCLEAQRVIRAKGRLSRLLKNPLFPRPLKKVQMQGGAPHCGLRIAECGMGGAVRRSATAAATSAAGNCPSAPTPHPLPPCRQRGERSGLFQDPVRSGGPRRPPGAIGQPRHRPGGLRAAS